MDKRDYILNAVLSHARKTRKLPLYMVSFHISSQLSGAMIRISNCEDRDSSSTGGLGGSGGHMDRTITMTGNAESVALAQYLINMR
jgi:hypothetical protein